MTISKTVVAVVFPLGLIARMALGVPPTISVTWDESPPPVQGIHYEIYSTDPDLPDVELLNGSLTWRIWSVDTDNPGQIGDIGQITGTGAENYVLRIMRPDGTTPGARDVRSIDLVPGDTSKYSGLVDSELTNRLLWTLTLEDTSGGVGGVVDGLVAGAGLGSVTVPRVQSLTTGNGTQDWNIGEILSGGTLDMTASTSYAQDIAIGAIGPNGTFRVGWAVAQQTEISVGSLGAGALMEFGYDSSQWDFWGDLTLTQGLSPGATVRVQNWVRYSTTPAHVPLFDLNGQPLAGTIEIGSGFQGTLNVGSIPSTGVFNAAGIMPPGQGINVGGDVDGSIVVPATSADINIGGDVTGSMTITNFSSEAAIRIDGSLASGGVIDFYSLAGLVVIDADADEVGQWLGTIKVDGTTLTPGCYWEDSEIGGGSIVLGPQMDIDCNVNEVPDACEIADDPNLDCNQNGILDECEEILSAKSCLVHEEAGEFCIEMKDPAPNVEPRLDGVNKLVLTLDWNPDSFNPTVACVNDQNYNGPITPTINGNVVTLALGNAMPDQDACTVTLDCNTSFCVRTLRGDISQDGTVSPGDASIIKPHFGEPLSDANCRYDFDVSGEITPGDFSQVKPLFGHTAPTCP